MAVKIINGVKHYPAFRTEAHAHDIEYRRNKALNELDDAHHGVFELTAEQEDRLEKLADQLTEILQRISFPTTYLPWDLYKVARDTIGWAAEARARY